MATITYTHKLKLTLEEMTTDFPNGTRVTFKREWFEGNFYKYEILEGVVIKRMTNFSKKSPREYKVEVEGGKIFEVKEKKLTKVS